ncbi:MAG: EscU/YscU/HrcU family type III secretion system export apparatus switch protein [Negativicutes bacterium]
MDNEKVEPKSQAVAIHYDADKGQAPKVIAKGSGFVADEIIKIAQKNAVPIYQNKTLAGVLMAVDLDREIPAKLYQAVAEVLAYIYRMDQKAGQKGKHK